MFTKANLCIFYGPAAITQFAEFPEPYEFVMESFQAVVGGWCGAELEGVDAGEVGVGD